MIALSIIAAILTLWLAGLTWYVIRLALAPVPVQDVAAAVRQMAVEHVRHAAKTSPGRDAIRARLTPERLAALTARQAKQEPTRGSE